MPYTLSSPIINTNEWKCLRLWYFIGATNLYKTSLQVFLQSLISNLSTLLFFVDEMASATNYTQIPLPGNYSKAKVQKCNSCWYTCEEKFLLTPCIQVHFFLLQASFINCCRLNNAL